MAGQVSINLRPDFGLGDVPAAFRRLFKEFPAPHSRNRGTGKVCGSLPASRTAAHPPLTGEFPPPPNRRRDQQRPKWFVRAVAQPTLFPFLRFFRGRTDCPIAHWNEQDVGKTGAVVRTWLIVATAEWWDFIAPFFLPETFRVVGMDPCPGQLGERRSPRNDMPLNQHSAENPWRLLGTPGAGAGDGCGTTVTAVAAC